ncbi:hypothetical protein [Streptomyces canus]|uniref:hypothetical protein n=1 Tax=Streptomyces canus TaxID=58343 RepID=UPI003250ADE6|nr:hypothetical protein OH837_46950 [Streptomyces canus]
MRTEGVDLLIIGSRGLLAAGSDTGGLWHRAYAGGLASALVFGLTAAETATEPTHRP